MDRVAGFNNLAIALVKNLNQQFVAGGRIGKFQSGLAAEFTADVHVFHGSSLGNHCGKNW